MRERLRVAVRGAVQGVGFRPFVYRLAQALDLRGWVLNSAQGVFIEAEAEHDSLAAFLARLEQERPPRALIHSLEASWLDPVPYERFEIRESAAGGAITALVLPDIALCDDCRRDILDPSNRRHRYPFTNCTNCGPRFSIIDALPYDRSHTSMRGFRMCEACEAEYRDPRNRRFHAQPNACPVCGPQLALWDSSGHTLASADDALQAAIARLRAGRIVAVKGIGGFHLMVDAGNDAAIRRLRTRKHREAKPLAILVASRDMAARICEITAAETRLLTSPEAPIVLLARRREPSTHVSHLVAPRNPNLGVLLPYSPLHLLLSQGFGGPLVATSGNLSDEPICTDEHDALARLANVADDWLVHDRPIVRPVDDSVARVMLGRELVLRRSRGFAPLPVPLGNLAAGDAAEGVDEPAAVAVLGAGAHLKSTIAVAVNGQAFLSQHIGDLETVAAAGAYDAAITSLESLYQARPAIVAVDLHPDYLSSRRAQTLGIEIARVQHHHAHVLSCMVENDLRGPVLGVAWDGTGLGLDRTIWGGEWLRVDDDGFTRFACLRPFRLPGGDAAARDPRRSLVGVMHALDGGRPGADAVARAPFAASERTLLMQSLARGLNAPVTTSAGRLFDAIAALTGVATESRFEGEAAMALEQAAAPDVHDAYPIAIESDVDRFAIDASWTRPRLVIDWAPTILAALHDVRNAVPAPVIAARVHHAMAHAIAETAARADCSRVVLSGGCFQNRLLTERTVAALRARGLQPYWHQRVPPNDGGIALGQVAAVLQARQRRTAERRDLSCV